MKKTNRFAALLLSISVALSAMVTVNAAVTEVEQGDIVVLYTNDVHCAVDKNIGYAGLAAYRSELKQVTDHVTLVDAGDAIQGTALGTLSKGSYPVDILNELGYDVAVPGNHEFDFGMNQFLKLAQQLKCGYTSSNFTDLKTGKQVFNTYKMFTYGEKKVAYVGITTPETYTKSTPTYFQDEKGNVIYGFLEGKSGAELYAAVQKAIDSAREAGADYVVAVGHCGIEESSAPFRSTDIIANVSGLNAFLDGHSHNTIPTQSVMDKSGKQVLLSSTGSELAAIGQLVIKPDGTMTTELVINYAGRSASMATFIKDIQSKNEALLTRVIARTDVTLTASDAEGNRAVRRQETNLGDLLADAFRIAGKADIGWINGGGIRADLPKGNITYGQIIDVFPYGNELCVMEITGAQILDMLEMATQHCPQEDGSFPHVSGMSYTIDTTIPTTVTTNDKGEFTGITGARRISNVKIGGKDLDPKATYTISSISYILKNGGDGLTMIKDNKLLVSGGTLDTDVVIQYLTGMLDGVVTADYAAPQGRITISGVLPFVDVPADAWYYDGVVYAYENNLFSGKTATTFAPAASMTRGQLVTVLWRMAGQPAPKAENSFSDVQAASAYAKAIAWASENGVSGGYSDGTFRPDKAVTREQFATILYNYAKLMKYDVTAGGMALKEYKDYASISSFALPAMTWANAEGLMQGSKATNTVNPQGLAPRSQVAVILQRFCTTVAK